MNQRGTSTFEALCVPKTLSALVQLKESPNVQSSMLELLCFVLAILAAPFKSRRRLEAENAVLRHQLIILRHKVPGRVRLTNGDRWFLVQLYRLFPSILQGIMIIRPETVVRWHRAGFRGYWRWKSGSEVWFEGRAAPGRIGPPCVDQADEH
jgi:hypothetical protein